MNQPILLDESQVDMAARLLARAFMDDPGTAIVEPDPTRRFDVNRALFAATYGLVAPITQGQCNTFDPAKRAFGLVTSTLDEDNVAWRLALDWTPSEEVLVFGSISRGAAWSNSSSHCLVRPWPDCMALLAGL